MYKFIVNFTVGLIFLVSFPSLTFGYTKLPNGNFEYTAEEISNITKVIKLKESEIENLKELMKIEIEKYTSIIKVKDSEIEKLKDIVNDTADKNISIATNVKNEFQHQTELYKKLVDNEREKFALMKNNSDEWKNVASELNKDLNKANSRSSLWKTISTALALGLVGVACSK